jgi:hypothetical protein
LEENGKDGLIGDLVGATRGKGSIIGWEGWGEDQRIFEAPR